MHIRFRLKRNPFSFFCQHADDERRWNTGKNAMKTIAWTRNDLWLFSIKKLCFQTKRYACGRSLPTIHFFKKTSKNFVQAQCSYLSFWSFFKLFFVISGSKCSCFVVILAVFWQPGKTVYLKYIVFFVIYTINTAISSYNSTSEIINYKEPKIVRIILYIVLNTKHCILSFWWSDWLSAHGINAISCSLSKYGNWPRNSSFQTVNNSIQS